MDELEQLGFRKVVYSPCDVEYINDLSIHIDITVFDAGAQMFSYINDYPDDRAPQECPLYLSLDVLQACTKIMQRMEANDV